MKSSDEKDFCPICSGLTEKVINSLLSNSIVRTFKPNNYIYMQETAYKGIYIITKGEVELANINEDGKKVFISKVKPKESFGESGLANLKYLENSYTLSETTCIFIPAKIISELMDEHAELSTAVLKSLNEWLVTFYNRFKMLSQTSVRKRLELYLKNESKKLGADEFEFDLRKHEIASNIGVRPETLSRLLKELSDNGQVSFRGKKINVMNLKKIS